MLDFAEDWFDGLVVLSIFSCTVSPTITDGSVFRISLPMLNPRGPLPHNETNMDDATPPEGKTPFQKWASVAGGSGGEGGGILTFRGESLLWFC